MTINLNSGKGISFLFSGSWFLSEDATVNILHFIYQLILHWIKMALTWLSHLNSKQGKVYGQVSDKEAWYVPQSQVHRVFWQNISDGRQSGRCLESSSHRLRLVSGHWGKVSPGHRLGSRGHDWQHYQSNSISSERCHLENSWEPDSGVTPS